MLLLKLPLLSESVPRWCCVYRLIAADGKQYVGQTQNLQRRAKEHARAANQTLISRAIRKHGAQSFVVEILELCLPMDLDASEKAWVAKLGSMTPAGFNLRSGGRDSEALSAESRQKISDALSGRKFSSSHVEKLAAAHAGKRHTEASRARMSVSHTGKKRSAAAKAAMAAAQTRRWDRWREEKRNECHAST